MEASVKTKSAENGTWVQQDSNQSTYEQAVAALLRSGLDFLIGGGHAFNRYTKMNRASKDFDLFVRKEDLSPALNVLAAAGFATELSFPHWLGKAREEEIVVDVIYGSGNGVAAVDDGWFEHAESGELFEHAVRFCPVEEMIWSKSFIMERERYDGGDIAHLLHAQAETMDWPRLLARYGPYWEVLLSHLVLFHFIYPFDRYKLPHGVTQLLLRKLRTELSSPIPDRKVCRGTLLSRAQYLVDVEDWGYRDGRLEPPGEMKQEDIEHWTAAMKEEGILA
jgi:hypothetical protein